MAHTQTKTPTKAAEFIIAHNKSFEDEILSFQKSILIKSQQLFSIHFQILLGVKSSIVNNTRDILNKYKDSLVQINQGTINTSKSILFNRKNELVGLSSQIVSKPKIILYNRISDIRNTISNLSTFKSLYLKNQRGYLGHYVSIIKMMAPENILKKGFAIVKVDNKITSNPDAILVGGDIEIILASTQITTTVKKKQNTMEQNLTYEEAYAELATIAKDIENESVSVDVLAEKVKRASELITFCQTKLKSTESEVNKIISQMENANK
jgi:exodeoxyribonuclease VII large subunit